MSVHEYARRQRSSTDLRYEEGYAEGRRTALHAVDSLPVALVAICDPGDEYAARHGWRATRAYWVGFRRAMRLHYSDAYRPNVLAARKRRAS